MLERAYQMWEVSSSHVFFHSSTSTFFIIQVYEDLAETQSAFELFQVSKDEWAIVNSLKSLLSVKYNPL